MESGMKRDEGWKIRGKYMTEKERKKEKYERKGNTRGRRTREYERKENKRENMKMRNYRWNYK